MSIFTQDAYAKAASETDRLQGELDITNADHIELWLEANLGDETLGWLACRIVEAHEQGLALPQPSAIEAEREAQDDVAALVARLRAGPVWSDGSPIGGAVGEINRASMREAADTIERLAARVAEMEASGQPPLTNE